MFDFGFGYSEMFVVAVVAIIVIGPKDLPKVLRALGKTVAKMRGMAREFQGHLDQALKETGFDEVKKEFDNIKNPANFIDPSIAKKATEDATKKQVDDFKKLFGDVPAADAPKAPAASTASTATTDTPAAAS
ncbi:MAG: Sec-independent protein translocase protein TatB [Hyphomicrobiales bacterium]